MLSNEVIERFEKAGFRRWTNYGKDRLYVEAEALGLSCDRYNTGNISYAEWQGEKISNKNARKMTETVPQAPRFSYGVKAQKSKNRR